jgi:hypothetical protein
MALRMPDMDEVDVGPKMRTILIQPDLDRVCVTWVGEFHDPVRVGPGKAAKIRSSVQW